MNKTNILALTGILGLAALPLAHADDDGFTPDTTHVVIDLGGHQGGDNLVNTTSSITGETKSVDAGDGIFGDIGLQYNFADSDFGWKPLRPRYHEDLWQHGRHPLPGQPGGPARSL